MSKTAIKVENLSKLYRLGEVGTGTISHDLNRWWAKLRGKHDPFAMVGQINDRTQKAQKGEQVWALQDINFEVPRGEVLGIIGKNGAGKSTLLKLLSKITAPTTGSIKARGRLASLLEVGTGMHPEMTGKENVYLNGTILGMTKREIDQKFDDIMDFAGCAKYADTPVKRYSSGMKVRLGFAVAAFLEPEILIVDEVLAVGDAEFQKRAIGKMQEVSHSKGRTVLFVSHNMASIQSLCNNCLLLMNGKQLLLDQTDTAIKYYLKSTLDSANTLKVAERKDRKGGKILRIVDFEVTDAQDNPLQCVQSGMDIQFKFYYEAVEELTNVVVRIQVLNAEGNVLATLNNYHCDQPFSSIPQTGVFACAVPKLPLIDGEYYLNVTCLKDFDIVDEVEHISKLTVEFGDFFGTGKLPVTKSGLLIQNTWQVDEPYCYAEKDS